MEPTISSMEVVLPTTVNSLEQPCSRAVGFEMDINKSDINNKDSRLHHLQALHHDTMAHSFSNKCINDFPCRMKHTVSSPVEREVFPINEAFR